MKQDDLKEQCMKLHIALSVGDSRNINTVELFSDCIVWEIISEDQECTNPRCPVPRLTKLCTMATNIFNIITALFSWWAKMCITTHAPSRKCQRALSHGSRQNCGCLVWNLLHVSPLAPGIWRWFLDFWEVCEPLLKMVMQQLKCFNKDQVKVSQLWLQQVNKIFQNWRLLKTKESCGERWAGWTDSCSSEEVATNINYKDFLTQFATKKLRKVDFM